MTQKSNFIGLKIIDTVFRTSFQDFQGRIDLENILAFLSSTSLSNCQIIDTVKHIEPIHHCLPILLYPPQHFLSSFAREKYILKMKSKVAKRCVKFMIII